MGVLANKKDNVGVVTVSACRVLMSEVYLNIGIEINIEGIGLENV